MLQAILHGKRRGSGIKDLDRQTLFDSSYALGAEDLITASVFERISYLPVNVLDIFWQTLLPEVSGLNEILNIHYWPHFYLNGSRVEPDIVIEASNLLLIVEAKRHDYSNMQFSQQLSKELVACREFFQGNIPIVILGLGGMKKYDPEEEAVFEEHIRHESRDNSEFRFYGRSWASLYRALDDACANEPAQYTGVSRILADISQVYHWHGLRTHPDFYLSQLEQCLLLHEKFPTLGLEIIPPTTPEFYADFLSSVIPAGLRHLDFPFGIK